MHRRAKHRDNLHGYLFVLPALVVIGLFGIFPIFFTVYVSLHRWRIKRGGFLGFLNYLEVFGSLENIIAVVVAVVGVVAAYKLAQAARRTETRPLRTVLRIGSWTVGVGAFGGFIRILPAIWSAGDAEMLNSLRVTIWYSLGTVPVQLAFGLLLAVLLDRKFRGRQAFRVVFLLPYIVPSVASAAVFERLFSLRPESFANQLLLLFGAKPLQWLLEAKGIFELLFSWGAGAESASSTVAAYWLGWASGPSLALVSIMFFNYWVFVGYYALIYANGLSNIPRELYEAAEVDGASRLTVLRKIIIPLISPATYFLTMLGIIGTFKAFNHIYVLRNAAVRGAADPISIYIFFTFFRKSRFGYASALSLVLFAIVMALTVYQRRVMEKRVFYGE